LRRNPERGCIAPVIWRGGVGRGGWNVSGAWISR
jgi:hypothetical protein